MNAVQSFKRKVMSYYKSHKRDLAWRNTKDPYSILISEIMLQQTQVSRVVHKYDQFLGKFPTCESLAAASLKDVLEIWHGLGYNRRALSLHKLAQIVVSEHGAKLPATYDELLKLPGIGPYTANALLTFIHNKKTVFIETNIRTVFIHFFFNDKKDVDDKDILPLVEKTVGKNPKEWYYALMDYGAMLKKIHNFSKQSKHYQKQSKFVGSNRQKRAQILREITKKPQTIESLSKKLNLTKATTKDIVTQLIKDGFLKSEKNKLLIA